MSPSYTIDSKLDLTLEKIIDVTPEQVWRCWTEPQLLMKWFCPKPWKTTQCEIDLIPGGKFTTVMQGPEGQEFHNSGCFLEVKPNQKLVWTAALLAGYRPQPKPENGAGILFSVAITMEAHPQGCKYNVIAIHSDEDACNQHRTMGFHEGWGAALNQLVEVAKGL